MTLVLKLDLDMVLIYHCAKKKVSTPSASKVTARTATQTLRKQYPSTYAGGNKENYTVLLQMQRKIYKNYTTLTNANKKYRKLYNNLTNANKI